MSGNQNNKQSKKHPGILQDVGTNKRSGSDQLQISTWNIGAINNNPFEYWITYNGKEQEDYETLMNEVNKFVNDKDAKGGAFANDINISDVFTNTMFEELKKNLQAANANRKGAEKFKRVDKFWYDKATVQSMMDDVNGKWTTEEKEVTGFQKQGKNEVVENPLSKRKLLNDFLHDETLGGQRFTSKSDLETNTIELAGKKKKAFRPTAINMYKADSKKVLSSVENWWPEWLKFMFGKDTQYHKKITANLLKSYIRQGVSYTDDEKSHQHSISILCLAIFDASVIYMMNEVQRKTNEKRSTKEKKRSAKEKEDLDWQKVQGTIVESFTSKKFTKTIKHLNAYSDSDVITLQEVTPKFVEGIKEELNSAFRVEASKAYKKYKQNSIILLNKKRFEKPKDITTMVLKAFRGEDAPPITEENILAITTKDKQTEQSYMVVSFHGDSKGLATEATLIAIMRAKPKGSQLIFGLDSNTHVNTKVKKGDMSEYGVKDWKTLYSKKKAFKEKRKVWDSQETLISCWRNESENTDVPKNTTYSGRTAVQPQFSKAIKKEDLPKKGNLNPKDFILFVNDGAVKVEDTWRDNTGKKKYYDKMPFPTLDFLSDHAIVTTIVSIEGKKLEPPVKRRNSADEVLVKSSKKKKGDKAKKDKKGVASDTTSTSKTTKTNKKTKGKDQTPVPSPKTTKSARSVLDPNEKNKGKGGNNPKRRNSAKTKK